MYNLDLPIGTGYKSVKVDNAKASKKNPDQFASSIKNIAAYAFVGFVVAGTGASTNQQNSNARMSLPSSPHTEVINAERSRRRDGVTPSRSILFIKSAFGMTMIQLAQALQVERQTIYQWLDDSQIVSMQSRNKDRLSLLFDYASQWNKLSSLPASKALDTFNFSGSTLLDLLSSEALNNRLILDCMQSLSVELNSKQLARRSTSISQKLKDRGFSPPPDSVLISNTGFNADSVAGLFE
ncbi:MAG TPA: hypothetical protein VGJ90_07560 [Methylophilaceae bacterium]|jgi:DNA-binding XRE family transcriptional regulator